MTWSLPRPDIDELIALGKAMVLQSPSYAAIIRELGGMVPLPHPSVAEICEPYRRK